MRKVALYFFLCLMGTLFACNPQPKNPIPTGILGDQVRAALQQAKQEKKNVLLSFYGDWCGACKSLHKKMDEPDLSAYLKKNFIILPINEKGDKENLLQNFYRVRGFPDLVVLDAQGQAVASLPEQTSVDIFKADGLRQELEKALKGVSILDQLLASWGTATEKNRAELAHKITEVYITQQNETEMLKWLDRTVQADKGEDKTMAAWTAFDVAMDFYEKRDLAEKADYYYRKVFHDYPKYQDAPSALLMCAARAWNHGSKSEAKQLFEKSLTVDPGNLRYIQNYVDFCAVRKWELDRALELIAEALKNPNANKDEFHLSYTLLELELAKGNCIEAAKLFGELSAQEPQTPKYQKRINDELERCGER